MSVLREIRRRAKVLVGPVFGLALIGYFAYHLVEGDRGLRAWLRVTQELRGAKENLAAVAAEPAPLEHPASHLPSHPLDPALPYTQARPTLPSLPPSILVSPT